MYCDGDDWRSRHDVLVAGCSLSVPIFSPYASYDYYVDRLNPFPCRDAGLLPVTTSASSVRAVTQVL